MPAGRPPNDDVAYEATITTRWHPNEKERLGEEARLAGLSVSEYVRRRVQRRAIVAHVDRQMINELRRIGGLLKKVHSDSRGAYSAQTAEMLRDIQRAIKGLAK